MKCPTCGAPSPPGGDWDQFKLEFVIGVALLALTRSAVREFICQETKHEAMTEQVLREIAQELREWLQPYCGDTLPTVQ